MKSEGYPQLYGRKIILCFCSRSKKCQALLQWPEKLGWLVGLEPDHDAGRPVLGRPLHSQHAGCSGGRPSALHSGGVAVG